MNIFKIIPDTLSLSNVSRFYVIITMVLFFDSSITSHDLKHFINSVLANSYFYVAVATIIILEWRLLSLSRISGKIRSILLAVIPLASCALVFYLTRMIFSVDVIGRIFFISAVCYLFSYFELYRQAAMTPIRNELILESLQNKLKPHFLFNSINAVLACMRDDPKLAERMLEDLSELFRNLALDDRVCYSLKEDIHIVERFIDIECIRRDGELNVIKDIDSPLLTSQVPFLLLQPLVENAIKYGKVQNDGFLKIAVKRKGNSSLIIVENTLNNDCDSTGVGTTISNLKNRLNLLYDSDASIEYYRSNGLFRIQILIPTRY